MVFMISYDLNKAGKDYEGVFTGIKEASNGVWCHFLDSTWLIKSNFTSASDVFKKIQPYIDSDDRCLVFEVKGNYYGWMTDEQWAYIKENIFG
jgi:hypothetical protein